jgi:hypothetical protein
LGLFIAARSVEDACRNPRNHRPMTLPSIFSTARSSFPSGVAFDVGASASASVDSALVRLLQESLGETGGRDSGAPSELATRAAARWHSGLLREGITLPSGPRDLAWWECVGAALAKAQAPTQAELSDTEMMRALRAFFQKYQQHVAPAPVEGSVDTSATPGCPPSSDLLSAAKAARKSREQMGALSSHSAVVGALAFFLPASNQATPDRALQSLRTLLRDAGESLQEGASAKAWLEAIATLWQRWARMESLAEVLAHRCGALAAAEPQLTASILNALHEYQQAPVSERIANRWLATLSGMRYELQKRDLVVSSRSAPGLTLRTALQKGGVFVPADAMELLLQESAKLLRTKGLPDRLVPESLAARADLLGKMNSNSAVRALLSDPSLSEAFERLLKLHDASLVWRADQAPLLLALVQERLTAWGSLVQAPADLGGRVRLVLELESKREELASWESWLQKPSALALLAKHGVPMGSTLGRRLALGQMQIGEILERELEGLDAILPGSSGVSLMTRAEWATAFMEAQWALEQHLMEYPVDERMLRSVLGFTSPCDTRQLLQQLIVALWRAEGFSLVQQGGQVVERARALWLAQSRSQQPPLLAQNHPDALLWEVWGAMHLQNSRGLEQARVYMADRVQGVLPPEEMPEDPLELAVVALEIDRQRAVIPDALLDRSRSLYQVMHRRLSLECQRLQPAPLGDRSLAELCLEIFRSNQSRALDQVLGSSSQARNARPLLVREIVACVHQLQPRFAELQRFVFKDTGLSRLPIFMPLLPRLARLNVTLCPVSGVFKPERIPREERLDQELDELGVAPSDRPVERRAKNALIADINLVRSLERVWWPSLPLQQGRGLQEYAALVRVWLSCQPEELQQTVSLNLSGLGLTRFPSELGHCTFLTELDLSCNQLRSEGLYDLYALKELRVLNVSRNCLERLHSDWFASRQVCSLNLSHNQLSEWPKSLFAGPLSGCRFLDLSHNQLSEWPHRDASAGKTLRALLLHGNPIARTQLSASLASLRHLSLDEAFPFELLQAPGSHLVIWQSSNPEGSLFKPRPARSRLAAYVVERPLPAWTLLVNPYLKAFNPEATSRANQGRRHKLLENGTASREMRLQRALQSPSDLKSDPQARDLLFGDLIHRDAKQIGSPEQYSTLWSRLDEAPPCPIQTAWRPEWELADAAVEALHEEIGETRTPRWVKWWLHGNRHSLGQRLACLPQGLQDRLFLSKHESGNLLTALKKAGGLEQGLGPRALMQALVRSAQDTSIQQQIIKRLPEDPMARCRMGLAFWFFGFPMAAEDRTALLHWIQQPSEQQSERELSRLVSVMMRWTPQERFAAAQPETFAEAIDRSNLSPLQKTLLLQPSDTVAGLTSPSLRAVFCTQTFLHQLEQLHPDERRSVEQWMVQAAQGALLKPRPLPYHLRSGEIADHAHINGLDEHRPLVVSYKRSRPDQPLHLLHLELHADKDRTSRDWPVQQDANCGVEYQVLPIDEGQSVEWEPSLELRAACQQPQLIGNRPLGQMTRATLLTPLAVEQMAWLHSTTQQALMERLRDGACHRLFYGALSSHLSPLGGRYPALLLQPPASWGSFDPVQILCADNDRKAPLRVAAIALPGWAASAEELDAEISDLSRRGSIWHESTGRAYQIDTGTWHDLLTEKTQKAVSAWTWTIPELAAVAHSVGAPPRSAGTPGDQHEVEQTAASQPAPVSAAAATVRQQRNEWDQLPELLGSPGAMTAKEKKQLLARAVATAQPLACLMNSKPKQARGTHIINWLVELPATVQTRLAQEQLAMEGTLSSLRLRLSAQELADLGRRLSDLRVQQDGLTSLSYLERLEQLPHLLLSCWDLKSRLAEARLQALPNRDLVRETIRWLVPDLDLARLDGDVLCGLVSRAADELYGHSKSSSLLPRRGKSDAERWAWILSARVTLMDEALRIRKKLEERFAAEGSTCPSPAQQRYQHLLSQASSPVELEWSSKGLKGTLVLGAHCQDLTKLERELDGQSAPHTESGSASSPPASLGRDEPAPRPLPPPPTAGIRWDDAAIIRMLQEVDPSFDLHQEDALGVAGSTAVAQRLEAAQRIFPGILGRQFRGTKGLPPKPNERPARRSHTLLLQAGWIIETVAVLHQHTQDSLEDVLRALSSHRRDHPQLPRELDTKVQALPQSVPAISALPTSEELRALAFAKQKIEDCRAALDKARGQL